MTIINDRKASLEFVAGIVGYTLPLYNYEYYMWMRAKAFNRNWIKRVK